MNKVRAALACAWLCALARPATAAQARIGLGAEPGLLVLPQADVVRPLVTASVLPEAALPTAVPAAELSAAILSRAESTVGLTRLGEEIQSNDNLPATLVGLEAMGLLKPGELEIKVPADMGRVHDVLEELWYHAAPHTPRSLPLDRSWAIPAIVAENEGVTYYVHAHFPHPSKITLVPPQAGRVKRLVNALESRALPLYSEQNLPKTYRFGYGREIVDNESEAPSLVYLRTPVWRQSPVLSAAAKVAWTVATSGWAATVAALHPDKPWAWAIVAGAVAYNYLFWSAWVPLRRWRELLLPSSPSPSRLSALNRRRWVRAVVTTRPDHDEFRRVQLPLPESSYRVTDFSQRAPRIASAVAEDARARGLSEVHILTGANHADEIAQSLAGGRAQVP